MRQKTPLVSVIIPVYNGKAVLQRAVKSVQEQTYRNLEIIIVDDGSTDGSAQLCDQIAQGDPRITVIHQENAGLSAARNAGLEIMTGNYVSFVDSDDSVDSCLIECLLDFLRAQKLDMATCSFAEVIRGKNGEASRDFHGFGRTSKQVDIYADALQRVKLTSRSKEASCGNREAEGYVLTPASFLAHMLCDDGFTTSAWGKLYRAELFRKVRFPVGKMYEDMGTIYRVVMQCHRLGFVNLPMYHYYQLENSIIHQQFSQRKLDLIELTDQACDEIEQSIARNVYTPGEGMILAEALRKRRMHARFSILRQLSTADRATQKKYRQLYNELIAYVKDHQLDILHNPLSSKRDIAATYVFSSRALRWAYGQAKRLR